VSYCLTYVFQWIFQYLIFAKFYCKISEGFFVCETQSKKVSQIFHFLLCVKFQIPYFFFYWSPLHFPALHTHTHTHTHSPSPSLSLYLSPSLSPSLFILFLFSLTRSHSYTHTQSQSLSLSSLSLSFSLYQSSSLSNTQFVKMKKRVKRVDSFFGLRLWCHKIWFAMRSLSHKMKWNFFNKKGRILN